MRIKRLKGTKKGEYTVHTSSISHGFNQKISSDSTVST
jgi:hypothetical protein